MWLKRMLSFAINRNISIYIGNVWSQSTPFLVLYASARMVVWLWRDNFAMSIPCSFYFDLVSSSNPESSGHIVCNFFLSSYFFLALLICLFENLKLVPRFDDTEEPNRSGWRNVSTATEPLDFLIYKKQ